MSVFKRMSDVMQEKLNHVLATAENPEEALAKAKLVQQIGAIIRQNKLSQTAAAEICFPLSSASSRLRRPNWYAPHCAEPGHVPICRLSVSCTGKG